MLRRRSSGKIGVETGGSNIQFAVNPMDGRLVVIEMNPRVSRSSALASKATGFPIAKIAAKLAVGYTLNEIPNDITKKTPASFEPMLDYVVVKIPKWAFEKFPESDPTLGTQMKSVGEVMAIGRTFKEAFLKGMRSLETGKVLTSDNIDKSLIRQKLITPNPDRIPYLLQALIDGSTIQELVDLTHIDPWFLNEMKEIADTIHEISGIHSGNAAAGAAARSEAFRFFRYAAGPAPPCDASADVGGYAREGRHHSGLQARRYLRCGVRIVHAVPVFDVRRRR